MISTRHIRDPAAWRRVLVFAPHPDDEALATAGLLQRAVAAGAAVRVVFVTDGENNPWPQRVLERRWRIDAADRVRWGARRRAEAQAALACLGVPASSAVFLHLPDRGLIRLLLAGHDAVVAELAAELRTWRPTLVAAPAASDRHPDHGALAVLLRFAVERLAPAERGFAELSYVVHGPSPPSTVLRLSLSSAERLRKRAAIACHRSQLVLSRRRLLAHGQPSEQFAAPLVPSSVHRVRVATVQAGVLSLVLSTATSLGAVLPATLDLLAQDADGKVHRQSLSIAPRQRAVVLRPHWTPVRLFVRCEHRHVFFDVAGWRELVMAPANAVQVPPLGVEVASVDPSRGDLTHLYLLRPHRRRS